MSKYQVDLLVANRQKLYNQGFFWAFNVAKYRALMSNDPTVIKYFYTKEAGAFLKDVYSFKELRRSFYFAEDTAENAEEYFGIIPMICESIAKMVCGSGYTLSDVTPPEYAERLKAILDDNEFDTEILKPSIIETLGIGSPAWHVHFDPQVSSYPIIELVKTEELAIKKKHNRITEYTIKRQVIIGGEPEPFELHTIYTRNKKVFTFNGAKRYVDDGIIQEHKIWDGSRYIQQDGGIKDKIFKEYGVAEKSILPLVDFPVIPIFNTINTSNDIRPFGIVFGLETVSSALDEILSNCTDTVRKAFPFLMISEQMIPSDIKGNKDRGAFSTRRHSFITPKNVADAEKMLQMIQARLNTTEYVEAAKFQINIALNKVGINAATLGLQLSGHVEAEATQNAKERNSIRTRNTVAKDYERYMSKLFAVCLQYEDYINGNEIAIDTETNQAAVVANDYSGIIPVFNKYIIDTPEEVSNVLAQKVQNNLMSIFGAVREQHPEWDNETVYKECNLIYAEKMGLPVTVFNPDDPEHPEVQTLDVVDVDDLE